MNTSLRDQLLNLGLVTEKQAKQASQQEQQRQFRDQRGKQPNRGPQSGQPGHHGKPQGKGGQRPPIAGQHAPAVKQSTAVQQAQAAKVARDVELNKRREDKAQRRARIAQIEQIVEQNRVERLDSDDHYSFIDGKKIRRMSVNAERREQLTSGELVIVRYKGHYAVVPKAAAERIRERDENMIVPHLQAKAQVQPQATAAAEAATEDPYKDFVVPDDLMW